MMHPLAWIVFGGLLMSVIAMVGGLTTLVRPARLERLLLPLVALAAGTLLGGAFFHMIPEGTQSLTPLRAAVWLTSGFAVFLALEQFLRWHHTHRATADPAHAGGAVQADVRKPVTYLVLIGDGVHNFLGGLAIASTFLIDPRAGVIAYFAAVAHEVPQELGDFGVLVHGGWSRRGALIANAVSALTFPLGAILAYAGSRCFDIAGLVLFGAGNFIYIAASDLIPEIKSDASSRTAALHFGFFSAGMTLMGLLAYAFHP
jgi:zinc and cadmium transporter